jgi:serine phosphatase RsbU (regulator of sigma subunit)
LEYTNAGHNPPLVIRGSRDPIPLDKGGPVLGMIQGSRYESDQIDLQTGDVLVLFTDGVIEADNPDGEEYTAKRLAGIVSSHLQQSPGELIETVANGKIVSLILRNSSRWSREQNAVTRPV